MMKSKQFLLINFVRVAAAAVNDEQKSTKTVVTVLEQQLKEETERRQKLELEIQEMRKMNEILAKKQTE